MSNADSKPQPKGMPAGCQLVPVEPTEMMLSAGYDAGLGDADAWVAMLAAAPTAAMLQSAQAPAPAPTGDLIELAAKAVFQKLSGWCGQRWDEGGNSFKQDEARRYARAALEAVPCAAVAPGPLTEPAVQRLVEQYGPQSEDEEAGFRDGIRAAEKAHGVGAAKPPVQGT